MDTYTFENDLLRLHDQELNLSFQEVFVPIKVPLFPIHGQSPYPEHVISVIHNEEGFIEEAFIEKNDLLNGQFLIFYPTGTIKLETFYQNNLIHGPSSFYSKKGSLLAREWFIKGKRQGKSHWYYPSGALYSIQRFVNGALHDKQEYYYENGEPKTVLIYSDGQLISAHQNSK